MLVLLSARFRVWLFVVLFFFFQAEDGIRDAQESRGLGDVYKRQLHNGYVIRSLPGAKVNFPVQACLYLHQDALSQNAVSYTHLTLPTIYSV